MHAVLCSAIIPRMSKGPLWAQTSASDAIKGDTQKKEPRLCV